MSNLKKRYGPYKSGSGHLFFIDLYTDGTTKSRWVHREVVEQTTGRALLPNEVVHHKNHKPQDNRPENLTVLDRVEHAILHGAERAAPVVVITCVLCGRSKTRLARHERGNRRKGRYGPFCGKSCAGKWSGFQRSDGVGVPKMENGAGPNPAGPNGL